MFAFKVPILGLLIFWLFGSCTSIEGTPDRYEFTSVKMGTQFQIILYSSDEATAENAARDAFERVEELDSILSDYIEESELNSLSDRSGSGVWTEVSAPLFHILELSKQVSEETGGLFDLTIGPYTDLWRGLNRMPDPALPDEQELENLSKRVGYQYIELDSHNRSARLTKCGMKLDPGGIAKGYAAEETLRILRMHEISAALVNAGGDITVGSPPPDKQYWKVAVPLQREEGQFDILNLQLSGMSVSTSGNMFQYIEIDGTTYSHIIDPRTGLGVTRHIQATVIAPDGTLADAYASALTIMDPEDGIQFVNLLEKVEAYVEKVESGVITIWKSDQFENFLDVE